MGSGQDRILAYEKRLNDTDEKHPINERQLQQINEELGLDECERRTVYRDVQMIQKHNPEIVRHTMKQRGYYKRHVVSPADCVLTVAQIEQSPWFSEEEVREINALIREHAYPMARECLRRQITVGFDQTQRRGNVRENMSVVLSAMEQRKRICFQYRNVGAGFDEILRHGGKWYDVSCYRIQVDGNRIYMYVGDAEAKKAKTFRLEHLYRVYISKEPMESPKLYYGNDPEKEIQRRVNESVFHFDGEPVRLRIIVQYEPFIMEMLLNLSHGRIQKMEDLEDGSKYVWFDTRRSEPLCRVLVSYADYLRVIEPDEVVADIRKLLSSANRIYDM